MSMSGNSMSGETVSHYKLLEKLGQGGMGVVYKAQDLKLDRFVALKFLPPHLSGNEEEKKRFMQEAKAASALDHPNICTIHEIDETADGRMFIAMAYYEGETLKQRTSSNQLPINSAIEIAMQIAQGLAKAHEHGIVHRDLKPENVIITKDGIAKIVDFGLAKLAGHTRLTKDGTAKGTAAYMSPEQARGEDTDHRTDIWSLGVVMYEMLTGHLPFTGEQEPAVVYSILTKEPKPASAWRADIPAALEQIVNRAMAKEADQRFQRAEEMQEGLEILKQQPEAGPLKKHRTTSLRALKRKRTYLYGGMAGLLVLLSVIVIYNFIPQQNVIASVAVLPFVNSSANPETEFLSNGLSEGLIRSLSQLPRLKVMSFSVVSRYKGEAADAQAGCGSNPEKLPNWFGKISEHNESFVVPHFLKISLNCFLQKPLALVAGQREWLFCLWHNSG